MRTPTIKGQYRRVEYDGDGCDVYQCMWCMKTVNIRDNPQYGWNFCPCCGKSWFNILNCRPKTTPAWAWNRYGVGLNAPPYYPKRKKATSEWYFEVRSRWGVDDDWGDWRYEFKTDYERLGEWQYAADMLSQFRLRNQPRDSSDFQYEYRVTLRKKT